MALPKVVFCIPIYPAGHKPHKATLASLKATVEDERFKAKYTDGLVHEMGNPYVSAARAAMLRKALDAKADIIVFLDSDVSWRVEDMLALLEAEGAVVAGTYRFKKGGYDDITGPRNAKGDDMGWYMGSYKPSAIGRPIVRESDGAIQMDGVPAGFLKIARGAVNLLMDKYPELCYGEKCSPHFDLFQHGAHKGTWWGEDMAFCRRWTDLGETVWCLPDMNIDHHGDSKRHGADDEVWRGNYHRYLLAQPGGSDSDAPVNPADILAKVRDQISRSPLCQQ